MAALPLMVSAATGRSNRLAPGSRSPLRVYRVDAEDRRPPGALFAGRGILPRTRHGAHEVYSELAEDPGRAGQRAGTVGHGHYQAAAGLVRPHKLHQGLHHIRGGDDANQRVILDDGETADPPLPHRVRRLFYRVVGTGTHNVGGHDLRDPDLPQRLRPPGVPEGRGRRTQVPIRDDPDEPPLFQNGQVPYTPLPANSERLRRRRLRREHHYLTGHRVLDEQHRVLPATPSLLALYRSRSSQVRFHPKLV